MESARPVKTAFREKIVPLARLSRATVPDRVNAVKKRPKKSKNQKNALPEVNIPQSIPVQ